MKKLNNINNYFMIDRYTLNKIIGYLKKCNKCNNFDTYNYNNECCYCKIYFCKDCNNELTRNYNYHETMSNYCFDCNINCFKFNSK